MFRKAWLRKSILILFGVDVAVFVLSWAPTTMFDYRGPETFERLSLIAGLVSLIGGAVLLPLVAIILLGKRENKT